MQSLAQGPMATIVNSVGQAKRLPADTYWRATYRAARTQADMIMWSPVAFAGRVAYVSVNGRIHQTVVPDFDNDKDFSY